MISEKCNYSITSTFLAIFTVCLFFICSFYNVLVCLFVFFLLSLVRWRLVYFSLTLYFSVQFVFVSCLFVYLFVCLFICLFICLIVYLFSSFRVCFIILLLFVVFL